MREKISLMIAASLLFALNAHAKQTSSELFKQVDDAVIAEQRANLEINTQDKGFGPQSPRNIDAVNGDNVIKFNSAPLRTQMNLCNIHFHKNAEHAGGEFSKYAGNGNGQGYHTGFVYSGALSKDERVFVEDKICSNEHGNLNAGDTIETHYVHTTAKINPGPTLGACFNDAINNPQLLVETQVYVLVNDQNALDFQQLNAHEMKNGLHQAINIPNNTGTPIEYAGSTTGPNFNEVGSPFQVTWRVRPKVAKVNIKTVGDWCKSNVFNEDHAHGVRNLITNPALLSPLQQ